MYKLKVALCLSCIAIVLLNNITSYAYESLECLVNNNENPKINAASAILIEAKTGRVLYAKDINEKLPMASTTKILTTIIALEQPNLNEEFIIKKEDITVEGSSMGLREGDKVNLEVLCNGMILPSGNDAANAVAVKISGSKEKFADLMNEKACEIGMLNSHFVTPSGLDDDNHYSTAYDMALLTQYAMQNTDFKEICKKSTTTVMLGNPPTERTLTNYNRLLKIYDYCIGVKTGYTDEARRCLVTAAQKDGIELIAITLNCSDDFESHIKLYDYFFDKLKLTDISRFTQNLSVAVAGMNYRLNAVPKKIPLVPLTEEENENLTCKIKLETLIYPPIEINQYLGEILVYSGENLVYKSPLVTVDAVEKLNKKISFIKFKK